VRDGQPRPLELPELPIDEAAEDIARLLDADGLLERAGGAVDELLAFTGGHPQRTMLLAHHLYDLLEAAGGGLDDPALEAIARALDETRDAHQALWDALPRFERIVCLALADGQAPTGSRAEEHRVARSTLQDALERLLADSRQVTRDARGTPYLLDPLFAEWLRRR